MSAEIKSNSLKRMRFAIYTRYSSDMQNDLSLEAQEEQCRRAILERGGVVVAIFSDGAKSGWSLDREGFNEMRRAAEKGRFDAIMFWKFDRLARNHEHTVMIKMLLRHEYGLKLYCVEGFSEDDDNSPYTAMMEQLLAVISAFYSKNLSSETKRGKYHRATKGEFNGSIAPLGHDLVTKGEATEDRPAGLYINEYQAEVVRQAFCMYATGNYSDATIAEWMNSQPVIQELRKGKQPVGKEMVRDLLQNRVYTGRVPYAETLYNGSLGEGKRSSRNRKQWFEGNHPAIISDELFEECRLVRSQMTKRRKPYHRVRTYLLHDRVYCARCIARKPKDLEDLKYGKMRPAFSAREDQAWYRCLCRDRGYGECSQGYIKVEVLDAQVKLAIESLTIPNGFKQRVEYAIQNKVEHADALARMEKIREAVDRIDFSWEKGFMTPDEYVAKRSELQREIELLRPVEHDNLIEAADMLENFTAYWNQCKDFDNPLEARAQLMAKIIDRIFVYDDQVIAIALHGEFGVVLGEETATPHNILEVIRDEIKMGDNTTENVITQCGSDGIRTRDLHLDRVAC